MTQKEKQLLLIDLCARLHYGVNIKTSNGNGILCSIDYVPDGAYLGVSINGAVKDYFEYQDTKPYLRSLSSMTEEERKELKELCKEDLSEFATFICIGHGLSRDGIYMFDKLRELDFLNSHHFDYRYLIPLGLALEAPDGMYV